MLLSCDASQLEWRTVLELSRDKTGIQEVMNGDDTHSINQNAFNLPSRLISKIYLFRTIFNWGKGYAFTVDPDFMHVSTSVKFWDDVGRKFYAKYEGIDRLYKRNLTQISQRKPLVGPLGREWLILPYKNDKGEVQLPITKAVNYPTQGTGADVMMLARISFRNRLRKASWGHRVKMVSTVHDSILVDTPGYEEELAEIFHGVFRDLPQNIANLFGYTWIVPLACEVKVGPNMKDMVKL